MEDVGASAAGWEKLGDASREHFVACLVARRGMFVLRFLRRRNQEVEQQPVRDRSSRCEPAWRR